MRKEVTLQDLNLAQLDNNVEAEIASRATVFARMAMADVEYGLAAIGETLTAEQYATMFKAMMVRKAKNELRKHNAS